MPWTEILVGLAMVLGLVGTVVPVWPGLVVVWAAGLVYGLIAGFGGPGGWAFAAMTVLALLGSAAKLWLPTRTGAARGAPASTLLAAVVGAVVGAVVLPAFGLPLGALAGLWAAERRRLGDGPAAWSNTLGIVRAFGIGVLVELGLGSLMLAVWLVWAVTAG